MFQIFEGRTLRIIYGPVKNKCTWRTRYTDVLHTLYNELDIVKVIKIGRLR